YFYVSTSAMVLMLHGLLRRNVQLQTHLARSQRHVEHASRLRTLTAMLGSVSEPDLVASIVVREGCLLLGSQTALVVRVSDGGEPAVDSFWGVSHEAVTRFTTELSGDAAVLRQLRDDCRPIWLHDDEAPMAPVLARWRQQTGARSLSLLPLATRQRSFGALLFTSKTALGQQERDLAMTVANQCAQTLERLRLAAQARRGHALLEHEHRWLEQILDVGPIATLLVEPLSGRLIFANEVARAKNISRIIGGPSDAPMVAHQGSLRDAQSMALLPAQMPYLRTARGESLTDEEVQWHSSAGISHLTLTSLHLPACEGHGATAIISVQDVSKYRRSQQALQAAVRGREAFVAAAGHELRTPLTALQLSVQSLQRTVERLEGAERLAEALPKVQQSLANQAHSVRRLVALVADVLDVSRLESGRLQLSLEPLDLGALVQDVVARMSDLSRRADCKVVVRNQQPLVVKFDRVRLEQVVTNLLSNAIKYGAGRPVSIDIWAMDSDACLEIVDHGIGIAQDQLQRIFERFERAASVRQYGGLGLGLWLAQQILQQGGGRIEVSSNLGEGATFRALMPLV
ncbi:MAG: GAF domain-containing sensor histidine kinase, partial [Deltaproteobacteria bacterium]